MAKDRMEVENGGSRPVPDPTKLTDEAIAKADKAIRDWTTGQLDVLRSRLDGMDTATDLRLKVVDHIPDVIDEKVKCVEDVTAEKFITVNGRFDDVARRTAEQKTDTKDALDAALQAAKDAVSLQTEASDKAIAKSELSTTKQIDALATLVDRSSGEKDEKINDLKSRLDRLEASRQGGVDQRTETRAQTTDNRALFGILIALGGLFLTAIVVLAAVLASGK